MGRSEQKIHVMKALRLYILANPAATASEVIKATGAARRTVFHVRKVLQDEGLLPKFRSGPRTDADREAITSAVQAANPRPEGTMLDGEALRLMAMNDGLVDDLQDEAATREKLLKQVQKMALDPMLPADLRLSATQVWVKVKDIVRTKDLGPGPPRTEADILLRLTRLLKAVGPKTALKAFDAVFGKEKQDDQAPSEPSDPVEGTPQAPDQA